MRTKCTYCGMSIDRKPCRMKGRNYCNASHQLKYEYTEGIRDRVKITKQANEKVRKEGFPNRKKYDVWNKGLTKETSEKLLRLAISRLGKNNPNWKEDKPPTRPNKNYTKRIKERDNFHCRICGYSEELQVHHIVPWHLTQDNSRENLVTLCRGCHKKMHDLLRKKLFEEYEKIIPVVEVPV